MNHLQRTLLALLTGLLAVTGAFARTPDDAADTAKVVTFRFMPGEDLFTLKGNEAELERLYALADEYRAEIAAGAMPVYVDGYCASLPTTKENLRAAFVRANRVKSELILRKGLKEADFITRNCARAYHNNKDVVVVTLRIPVKEQPDTAAWNRNATSNPCANARHRRGSVSGRNVNAWSENVRRGRKQSVPSVRERKPNVKGRKPNALPANSPEQMPCSGIRPNPPGPQSLTMLP